MPIGSACDVVGHQEEHGTYEERHCAGKCEESGQNQALAKNTLGVSDDSPAGDKLHHQVHGGLARDQVRIAKPPMRASVEILAGCDAAAKFIALFGSSNRGAPLRRV